MAHVLWNSDIDVYNPQVIPLLVARNISLYLDIPDLLLFSLTSRNAHKAVNDPQLWVLKLKAIGVWNIARQATKEELRHADFSLLDNPLTCFESIYKVPRIAKYQVLKITKCLQEYYQELQLNVPYERLKIFKNFHTPQDQAKILSNLLKYNAIDSDDGNKTFVRQKLLDLMEIFENAVLRELEIHYDIQDYENTRKFVQILIDLKNDQTLIDFFLQKTCFDNESIKFLNPETFNIDEFFVKVDKTGSAKTDDSSSGVENEEKSVWDTDGQHSDSIPEETNGLQIKDVIDEESPNGGTYKVNVEKVDGFMKELADIFNEEARIIDLIFPQSVPMMFKVSEEIISNQLQELVLVISSGAKERNVYLELAPVLYHKFTHDFLAQLKHCENVGESYKTLIHELIDAAYESYASEYMNEEKLTFRILCSKKLQEWKLEAEKREHEKTQKILKHVKVETKNDFLTSFRKVFTINGSTTRNDQDGSVENYSEMQARARILAENIKSLNEVFSPQLALNILNEAKSSLQRLLQFREFTISSIVAELNSTKQEEFLYVIDCIGEHHLKIGFHKALNYLKEYNPRELNDLIDKSNDSAIGPLVIFFELINMADMIVQMLDIFYKEEMINRKVVKHENSVLNPSLQSKRKLESMVDKFVADGLNTGIDVLFKEIESVYLSTLEEKDYNPTSTGAFLAVGPTKAATRAVQILDDNFDLLLDSADKSIVEVFQQEVAERFFQLIVKVLKRSTISVDGAVTLISDLNLYYDFILTHIRSNKRMIFPLFQALKKVGSIYLIGGEDAKAIGQLVSDLSKFNGIFSQEEIYEFVQRRQDWSIIKKHVEKVMYGLSLVDCVIM